MIPSDALDLLSLPSIVALVIGGAVYGGLVLAQSPYRLAHPIYTTFLAVTFMAVLFVYLTAIRAFTPTEHWGRTIGTGIQAVSFALGTGLGLLARRWVGRQ